MLKLKTSKAISQLIAVYGERNQIIITPTYNFVDFVDLIYNKPWVINFVPD